MTSRSTRAELVRERFKTLVKRWADTLRVRPRQIRIQAMTRKWGSCSPAGRVCFASLLLKEPRGFQQYVIVHELLHLRVRNHGRLHRAYVAAHLGAQGNRPTGLQMHGGKRVFKRLGPTTDRGGPTRRGAT